MLIKVIHIIQISHLILLPIKMTNETNDRFSGIQAQTVANFDLAKKHGLMIIPVLNKIDLKNADPEGCAEQMNTVFNIPKDDILQVK
jgi:translation elongation factor EF-4